MKKTILLDNGICMILKIKNSIFQKFSKSKLSKEEARDLAMIAPWIVLEITHQHESNQEVGKTLEKRK